MRVSVANVDADGFLYRREFVPFDSSGTLSIDQFHFLDEKYAGIEDETQKVVHDWQMSVDWKKWKELVEKFVRVAGRYKVKFNDFMQSAENVVRNAEITEDLVSVLKKINPVQMNVFTGSELGAMNMYISERIQPQIPESRVDVYGTIMEFSSDQVITGKVINSWDAEKRARKARELTEKKVSLNIGDTPNDLPMLREGTVSFYLTENNQKREKNII